MMKSRKLDYSLAPPEFDDIILPLQHSAETGKYGRNDWLKGKNFDKEQNYSSVRRHWAAYYSGQMIDPDSGLSHLLMASLRGMMQYTIDKRNKESIEKGFNDWKDLPKCDTEKVLGVLSSDCLNNAKQESGCDNYHHCEQCTRYPIDDRVLDALTKLHQTTGQYTMHPQHCSCLECRNYYKEESV